MNQTLVDRIVNAVLYEGYILYPYRPSVKNRQRWTFGGLYPQAYSAAQAGAEPWTMRTECPVLGNPRTTLTVTVRFLHLLSRQVGELPGPVAELPEQAEPPYRAVESLQVDGRVFHTWQEAVERTIQLSDVTLADLLSQPREESFVFPSSRDRTPIHLSTGEIVGLTVREQQSIEGTVELSAADVGAGRFKVRVRIVNRTPLPDSATVARDEALLRALVSTHTILNVRQGAFVSLTDPPEACRALAADCRNQGTWPVLVGEPGENDAVLSSPIILYDYPQVAPESPGDLFDGLEIDEILTLRILTLTDEEKQAMVSVDERAGALLRRTEALAREQLQGLHGTMRGLRPVPLEEGHD